MHDSGYSYTEHLCIEGPVCAGHCSRPGGGGCHWVSDMALPLWSCPARGVTDGKPASMLVHTQVMIPDGNKC